MGQGNEREQQQAATLFAFPPFFLSLWNGLLDVVYPPHCLLCDRSSPDLLCGECHGAFVPVSRPVCKKCGRPSTPGECILCRENGQWHFEMARSAFWHSDTAQDAIHRFKYQGQELLGKPLGTILAGELQRGLIPSEMVHALGGVVPVPMHKTKRRKRGFNQAQCLAEPIAAHLHIPLLSHTLTRAKKTRAQVGLSAEARRANLSDGVFAVTDAKAVSGKTLLLIDDVFTTGTTLNACAAALCNAGAKSVIAVTLTRAGEGKGFF